MSTTATASLTRSCLSTPLFFSVLQRHSTARDRAETHDGFLSFPPPFPFLLRCIISLYGVIIFFFRAHISPTCWLPRWYTSQVFFDPKDHQSVKSRIRLWVTPLSPIPFHFHFFPLLIVQHRLLSLSFFPVKLMWDTRIKRPTLKVR